MQKKPLEMIKQSETWLTIAAATRKLTGNYFNRLSSFQANMPTFEGSQIWDFLVLEYSSVCSVWLSKRGRGRDGGCAESKHVLSTRAENKTCGANV